MGLTKQGKHRIAISGGQPIESSGGVKRWNSIGLQILAVLRWRLGIKTRQAKGKQRHTKRLPRLHCPTGGTTRERWTRRWEKHLLLGITRSRCKLKKCGDCSEGGQRLLLSSIHSSWTSWKAGKIWKFGTRIQSLFLKDDLNDSQHKIFWISIWISRFLDWIATLSKLMLHRFIMLVMMYDVCLVILAFGIFLPFFAAMGHKTTK